MLFEEFKMCLFVSISTVQAVPGTSVARTAWFGDSFSTGKTKNYRTKQINAEKGRLLPSLFLLEARKTEDVEDLQIRRQETTHEQQT